MGKFAIKQAKNGPMFNLKARNGQIVGTSEVYSSMSACKAGIESVRKAVAKAKIEDQTLAVPEKLTNPKFEIYKDKRGEFRFRLRASNGENILAGEGYKSKYSCKNGIASICKNAPDAEVVEED
ncbi:MAG: YegP family protein [Eubacteriales bacterium]|nr:YegP family protein [Eubacteriales bacterium]